MHYAALKSISDLIKESNLYFNVNVKVSINLFGVRDVYDCKKIVLIGSANFYGHLK